MTERDAFAVLEYACACARLEPAQVAAVQCWLQGYRGAAIGAALGTSAGAGRVACSEGLKALRAHPWDEGEGGLIVEALEVLGGAENQEREIIRAHRNREHGSGKTPLWTSENPLRAELAFTHPALVSEGDLRGDGWR